MTCTRSACADDFVRWRDGPGLLAATQEAVCALCAVWSTATLLTQDLTSVALLRDQQREREARSNPSPAAVAIIELIGIMKGRPDGQPPPRSSLCGETGINHILAESLLHLSNPTETLTRLVVHRQHKIEGRTSGRRAEVDRYIRA
jgi:hypothetical protein